MKKLGFLFTAMVTLLMVSCTSLEDRLEGTWDLSLEASVLGFSETSTGTMTFNDDGTGTIQLDGESSDSFTWTANEDDGITIVSDGESLYLENTTNEKDKQVFVYSETEDGFTVTMTFTLTK